MSDTKLRGVGIREEKGRQILTTTYTDKERICKQCMKNPRAQTSSRCKECSLNFKRSKLSAGRLEEKIKKQINNKV